MYGQLVWLDLPDGLLNYIITFISSFCDLLAFAATCRPLRAAIYSRLSTFTFTFPPLLLYPNTSSYYSPPRQWSFIDPANPTSSLRRLACQSTLDSMTFLGGSYGHLIFSFRTQCCLLDVFTGTEAMPPHIPSTHGCDLTYGTLLAPLASPKSHLLVNNRSYLFLWHVGSDSWSEHPLDDVDIVQIMIFKGEIFAMDDLRRLFTIRLVPQLCIEELTVVCEKDMLESFFFQPWLVVCGDMLLSVNYSFVAGAQVGTATYEVFRLDVSNQPAKGVKVEKLENWALFVSNDRKSSAFACMSPERWGGQSNCVYHAHAPGSWTATRLDQHHGYFDLARESMYHVAPLWVLPNTLLLVNDHPM